MNFLWLYILLGVAAVAALLWLFVWFNNSCLTTSRYKVKINGASGKRIVHLSDLHGKTFGRRNSRLVKKIEKLKPDFIVITGDIIHLYTPKNKAVALYTVSALKEIAPVVFVSGNHEMRNKGYRFFCKDLKEAGAIVLDDTTAEVCGVTVTGLNGASLKTARLIKSHPKTNSFYWRTSRSILKTT
ncbi:MAG: metallophosphoesterase [Clostridia bacterium]|nr:metallophosphoesterase [Clostridia bacterium]